MNTLGDDVTPEVIITYILFNRLVLISAPHSPTAESSSREPYAYRLAASRCQKAIDSWIARIARWDAPYRTRFNVIGIAIPPRGSSSTSVMVSPSSVTR